jgi:hypothetical protein
MWEHGYLEWEMGEVNDMTEDAWIFKRFDGSATGPTEEFKEPSLNVIMFEIGQNGWEMISVHQKFHDDDSYHDQVFHFKRRVTD